MKNKGLNLSLFASAKVLGAVAMAEVNGGTYNFECDGKLFFDMTVYQIGQAGYSTKHCKAITI